MQITNEVLKPWRPCSDGYKWFVAKFPQGAEYTAVQKALREDKRFDDARWLTNNVWKNVILETPSVVSAVAEDHKNEALEIITSTTAVNVDVVDATDSDGGEDGARIGSSGYGARIGSSGYGARIGSSGYGAQIGSSGYDAQIGSSGYDARIGSSGNGAQIGSSGYGAQIGASGNDARIGSSGNGAQIGSSGYGAQIGASGYGAQIGSSGYGARINAEGENAVICCAGKQAKVKSGSGGAVAMAWHDGTRNRIAVGYVGEDLKANVWYGIQDGKLVEVAL
jgi:hypothetical protein